MSYARAKSLAGAKLLRHNCTVARARQPLIAQGLKMATARMVEDLQWRARYVDIGINLTDPVYQGIYHGVQRHPADVSSVIQRAKDVNCTKLIVTASDLSSSRHALELTQQYPGVCYATVGVHPCSCSQFTSGPSAAKVQLEKLGALAVRAKASGQAVAFGEIGLDYDRLALCPKDTQLEFFERQLDIAVDLQLPLFLHSRAAHADFMACLGPREPQLARRGVVHSFTGTMTEMKELLDRGWHIGVNGCSLKTEANCEVASAIPLDRLHLETDGPWCEMRNSHAGTQVLLRLEKEGVLNEGGVKALDCANWVKKEKWVDGCSVKGRNEPCTIPKVAWALAGLKNINVKEVVDAAWANSVKMFGLVDSP